MKLSTQQPSLVNLLTLEDIKMNNQQVQKY